MKDKKMSRTKIGAVLLGASMILGTLGGYFSGTIELSATFQALLLEVGGLYTLIGVRGWFKK